MTVREAIRILAGDGGDSGRCVVCTVDAVDETARTVDATPVDGGAPLLGVNLQAVQNGADGIVHFPAEGSFVAVAFTDEAAAAVVLSEKVDKSVVHIGGDNPVDATVQDGRVELTVGKSFMAVDKDGNIRLNGDNFNGLVKIDELYGKFNSLVDAFNKHTHGGVIVEVIGQAEGTEGNSKTPDKSAAKLDRDKCENKAVKHGDNGAG